MLELFATLKFGLMLVLMVLGFSCIIMAIITEKSGAEALKERIEFGMFGVSGIVLGLLLIYALT